VAGDDGVVVGQEVGDGGLVLLMIKEERRRRRRRSRWRKGS